jgi:hypothetical protein
MNLPSASQGLWVPVDQEYSGAQVKYYCYEVNRTVVIEDTVYGCTARRTTQMIWRGQFHSFGHCSAVASHILGSEATNEQRVKSRKRRRDHLGGIKGFDPCGDTS